MDKTDRKNWKKNLKGGAGVHILITDVKALKHSASLKSLDLKIVWDTTDANTKGTYQAHIKRKMQLLFEGRAILDELIKEEPKSEYLKEWTKARDFVKEFEDNIKGA